MELKKDQVEETTPFYGAKTRAHFHADPGSIRLPYLFVENAKNYVCIIGQDGYLRKISISFCEASGYSKVELFFRPFWEFLDISGHKNAAPVLGDRDMNYYFENSFNCKDGGYIDITWRYVPGIVENAILLVGWKTK